MGIVDRLFGIDKIVESKIKSSTAELTKSLADQIDKSLSKATTPGGETLPKGSIMRYSYNAQMQNNNNNSKKKPDSSVPFDVLRKFSVSHEISRAAINYRKRQLQGLDWDIVTAEDDQTVINEAQQKEIKQFFKGLGGLGNKYRKFTAKLIEDLLVLDAVVLYKQPTKGGKLYTLLPVDGATIRIIVDQSGGTPLPPYPAYRQLINGHVTGEFTTDEMIYEMMNPRTNSPYGLAPLESLLVTVSSSLKASLYNLSYLTEGNIPEGFFGVPKEWTPQMIKDFQENWDAVMAGDEMATAKLKFTPEGSYTPAKKPTDMAWELFNDWLMKVTCAMFDVQPTEIGFHPNKGGLGGAGMAKQGAETTEMKGLLPLASLIEEIFTEIIQVDLGAPDLQFKFTGLSEDKDALIEAQVGQIMLETGQRTIDELRTDDGLDELPDGVGSKPYILGNPTFIDAESTAKADQQKADAAAASAAALAQANGTADNSASSDNQNGNSDANAAATDDTTKMVALVTEFRKFRKMAIARKKAGKTFRPFSSTVLPQVTLDELNERIHKAADDAEVKKVFGDMMQDYQIEFLADVIELNGNLQKVVR